MKKIKEKIVEQIYCDDFKREDKRSPLSRGLGYLENLKFHSIAFCESKEREGREKRIILLPRHMKSLLDCFNAERGKLISEIEQQKAENLILCQANEQLMKNIEDKTLQEQKRPQKPNTYSSLFDDAGHQLKGSPLQGGLPGSGKNK